MLDKERVPDREVLDGRVPNREVLDGRVPDREVLDRGCQIGRCWTGVLDWEVLDRGRGMEDLLVGRFYIALLLSQLIGLLPHVIWNE